MMMAALAAMLVVAVIPVAFAQDRDDRQGDRFENRAERFEDNGFFFGDKDRFFDEDEDRFDSHNFNDGSGIAQESEQESESGDVDQTFDVSQTGDNSNQCVGIQGVANTGNAQNQTSLIQYGSESDDFEFDEVGSTIEVSPENSTTCDQQINQAASAFGS
jgi:hypothetical protein